MNLDCDFIKRYLSSFSLLKNCDVVRDGSLRISTPFQYPDGSLIDLFLEEQSNLFQTLELSDKGQTTAYLLDLQVKHWTTMRRKNIVSDICKALEVQQVGGVFKVSLDPSEIATIPNLVVRLAQTCIRVADLAFTQRFRTQGVFFEDVEEFISGTQRPYKTSVIVGGRFGNDVEFDFEVQGERVKSLVQTVSTPSVTTHAVTNEVFRKWYDVSHLAHAFQKITVYDSSRENFKREDIDRLSEVSEMVAFPAESDKLKEMIAA